MTGKSTWGEFFSFWAIAIWFVIPIMFVEFFDLCKELVHKQK